MKKYKVVEDLQNTDFALGVINDIEGWRQQAIEWADMDENDEIIEYLQVLKTERVIDFISKFWMLKFEEVEK